MRTLQGDRRWIWWLALCLIVVACDDGDDGALFDAGTACPNRGNVQSCYCDTGTLGLRTCINAGGEASIWSSCHCNEPPPPQPCTPGQVLACECPDGTPSTQICRAANTRDPCMCTSHLDMDAGSDAGRDMDASAIDDEDAA